MSKRFWFFCVSIWIVAGSFLTYLLICHVIPNPSGNIGPLVIYVSALIALAGWMVQTYNAARVGRKQHTMNLLIQTRNSAVYKEHSERVGNARREKHKPFNATTILADGDLDRSVGYILNYYEFIAVAIAHGDLDEKIMRDSIRGQLTHMVKVCDDYIADARKEDSQGKPDPEYALVYSKLLPLNDRWVKYHADRTAKRKWFQFGKPKLYQRTRPQGA